MSAGIRETVHVNIDGSISPLVEGNGADKDNRSRLSGVGSGRRKVASRGG
jgi:hypothetical protein